MFLRVTFTEAVSMVLDDACPLAAAVKARQVLAEGKNERLHAKFQSPKEVGMRLQILIRVKKTGGKR